MNVYVETNFVLELALLQEQHESCEEILRSCEAGALRLVLPAYSVLEPYETFYRRHAQRKRMKADLDQELHQMARSATHAHRLGGFRDVTTLLIDSADEEANRLEDVRSRLLACAETIPLDTPVLIAATACQATHGLSAPDAIVYASVLSHLARTAPERSYFLNRNSRDFRDPNIVEELRSWHCSLLTSFEEGLLHIRGTALGQ